MDIMLASVFFLGGIVLGAFLLVGYICSRMVGSDGWDDSNITNALRLLSHVTLHPEDFGRMAYVPYEADEYGNALVLWIDHGSEKETEQVRLQVIRPFWYIDKDELSEVVKTRP